MATARTPQDLVAEWRSLAQHWRAARSESRTERGRFRVRAEVYADCATQLAEVLAGEAAARAHYTGVFAEPNKFAKAGTKEDK